MIGFYPKNGRKLSKSAIEQIRSLDLKDSTIGYALRRKNFLGKNFKRNLPRLQSSSLS